MEKGNWTASELKERSASQKHVIDLCRMPGELSPAEVDPTGETYWFRWDARMDISRYNWANIWQCHHVV